jgi:hypothetical protein
LPCLLSISKVREYGALLRAKGAFELGIHPPILSRRYTMLLSVFIRSAKLARPAGSATPGGEMKLAIELSDQQAERLREEAARLGVEPEQLALAAVADLIAAEGPDFDSAAQRVLEKNRELYRRLA